MKYCLMQRIAFLVTVLVFVSSYASPPNLVNYQGLLADETGVPLEGSVDLVFRIYEDALTTTCLWEETHSNVEVQSGLFQVVLGSSVPITAGLFEVAERWLGVTVAGDVEIAPRMRLTSVPWAFRAALADSSLSVSGATDSDWVIDGDYVVRMVGNVGIGVSSPEAKLEVSAENNTAIRASIRSGADGACAVAGIDSSANANSFGVYGETRSQTNGIPPGQSGAGSAVGVYGRASSPVSSSGATLGVLGRCDVNTTVSGSDVAVGVFGWAPGVGGGAPQDFDARVIGVFGETWSTVKDIPGVYGINKASTGETRGVIGVVDSGHGGAAGVLGVAGVNGRGVMGYAGHSSSAIAIYGDARAASDIGIFTDGRVVGSSVGTYSPTTKGNVYTYGTMGAQAMIEDVGRAVLSEGKVRVMLDPVFLELATVDDDDPLFVQVQANGPSGCLWVELHQDGFTVHDPERSSVSVTYYVKAKRRGFESERLVPMAGGLEAQINDQ
jgi:hypothetical protein